MAALSEELSHLRERLLEAEDARDAEMKSRVSVETKLVELAEFKKSAEKLMATQEETIASLNEARDGLERELSSMESQRDELKEEKVAMELRMVQLEEEKDSKKNVVLCGVVVRSIANFEQQTVHLQDTVQHLKETMEREHLPLAEMEREREAFQEQVGHLESGREDALKQLEEEKAARSQRRHNPIAYCRTKSTNTLLDKFAELESLRVSKSEVESEYREVQQQLVDSKAELERVTGETERIEQVLQDEE
ncbi:adventurous-gliding motility protein Z-like [Patiria miniata]|uniref:Uncharacterized protein n=1 Tax=Patiria miniata TaxID=46514 RepID=A0A914B6T8_PATMI|nr:adventurous-gliding motility protein Z-like [Patiria miniata]